MNSKVEFNRPDAFNLSIGYVYQEAVMHPIPPHSRVWKMAMSSSGEMQGLFSFAV